MLLTAIVPYRASHAVRRSMLAAVAFSEVTPPSSQKNCEAGYCGAIVVVCGGSEGVREKVEHKVTLVVCSYVYSDVASHQRVTRCVCYRLDEWVLDWRGGVVVVRCGPDVARKGHGRSGGWGWV
jgi:hypothetical protein